MVENLELIALGVGTVSAIGGAGGAWGAATARIRQQASQIAQVSVDLEAHDKRTRAFSERLVRMETLLEQIDKRLTVSRPYG